MKKAKHSPIISHNRETESFKRPDHPDFMDASELAVTKFTGLRCNQLGLQTEIWVLGEMRASVSFIEPLSSLERKYKEIFGFRADETILLDPNGRHVK
jgi:hypothetical protein